MRQEDFTATATPYYDFNHLKNELEFTLYVKIEYKGKQILTGRLHTYKSEDGEIGDEIMYGAVYYNATKVFPAEDGVEFIRELKEDVP